MSSLLQQRAVSAITLARNGILYGVAVNSAALEGIEALAPPNDIVSGPLALTSAVQVGGWLAQYARARGYILRALVNTQLGSV